MKFIDINKRYTELVAEYLGKGYLINSATTSGSQGEISKIDLTNGTEVIRIMVSNFSDWKENIQGVELSVGRALDYIPPHSSSDWYTLWNSRLEELYSERYYKIGDDRLHGVQYGTLEEAKAVAELRLKRYIAKSVKRYPVDITDRAMDIAKRIIRREFGYKRISEDEVKVNRYNDGYTVGYRGEVYRLH